MPLEAAVAVMQAHAATAGAAAVEITATVAAGMAAAGAALGFVLGSVRSGFARSQSGEGQRGKSGIAASADAFLDETVPQIRVAG